MKFVLVIILCLFYSSVFALPGKAIARMTAISTVTLKDKSGNGYSMTFNAAVNISKNPDGKMLEGISNEKNDNYSYITKVKKLKINRHTRNQSWYINFGVAIYSKSRYMPNIFINNSCKDMDNNYFPILIFNNIYEISHKIDINNLYHIYQENFQLTYDSEMDVLHINCEPLIERE